MIRLRPDGTDSFRALLTAIEFDVVTCIGAGMEAAAAGALEAMEEQLSRAFPRSARAPQMVTQTAGPYYAQVMARGPGAAAILESFTEGSLIRSPDGFWLAIPMPWVPRRGNGRRMSPGDVEVHYGIALRLIPTAGSRPAYLVMDQATAARNGRGVRVATRRRAAQGRVARPTIMFALVPQAQMPKRLSPEAAIGPWFNRVDTLIDSATTET